MNYKKNSLIIIISSIISIQILLLINNRQKTTFRYFIWSFQDISIGRLICISSFSGFIINYVLSKTADNDSISSNIDSSLNEADDLTYSDKDNLINNENYNEDYEITPERDLRDPQPTISVNYRVIKNNGENESKDREQNLNSKTYKDDWNFNDAGW